MAHASIPADVHDDYGASYPLTYVFEIPEGAENLTAQWTDTDGGAWNDLSEPVGRFDGVAAARFDYGGRRAYLSVPFTATSDDLWLRVINAENVAVGRFETMSAYYDDRQVVVVSSYDDWYADTHADFMAAAEAHRLAGLWMSAGINANGIASIGGAAMTSTEWSAMNTEVAAGYLEPINHSLTHVPGDTYADAAQAESEIGDGGRAITDNVTMPPQSRRGATQYIHGFIEPHSKTSALARAALAANDYLADRSTIANGTAFSTWASDGLYERISPTLVENRTLDAALAETVADSIIAGFDTARAAGTIFHFYSYPHRWPSWGVGSDARRWLDYIGGHDDIWSVGLGHLYLYRHTFLAVGVVSE